MMKPKKRTYLEQEFNQLSGLDGISDEQITPTSFKPLLVLDVWEHAFMRDYKATERGRYLEAFFRNIDWQMVERRLQEPVAMRPAAAA